jgi:hypothetical protein
LNAFPARMRQGVIQKWRICLFFFLEGCALGKKILWVWRAGAEAFSRAVLASWCGWAEGLVAGPDARGLSSEGPRRRHAGRTCEDEAQLASEAQRPRKKKKVAS